VVVDQGLDRSVQEAIWVPSWYGNNVSKRHVVQGALSNLCCVTFWHRCIVHGYHPKQPSETSVGEQEELQQGTQYGTEFDHICDQLINP
jgi:hypothetical protein